MGVITYFQIFATYWCSTILYFLPGTISYKQYAFIVAVLSVILVAKQVASNSFKVSGKHFFVVCLTLVISLLFYFTPQLYGNLNGLYYSYYLVLIGQVLPIVIMAPCVSQNNDISSAIKKFAPVMSVIFTVIAFIGTFNPTSTTSGGYAANENGLNYQTVSYLAAYAAGLAEYYLVCCNDVEWYSLFRNGHMKIVMSIIVMVNLASILISGGRGGLAVFIVEIILSLFVWIKNKSININKAIKTTTVFLIISVAIIWVLQFALKSSITTSGFDRIVNTFTYGDSSGRSVIHRRAFESFLNSPIWGHGFGSVFYEIHNHSHNFIFDIMVETGTIGLIIWIIVLVYTVHRLCVFHKKDFSDYIWIIIFLDGIVMAFFSGYYLAQLPLIWAIVYVYCRKAEKNRTIKFRRQ